MVGGIAVGGTTHAAKRLESWIAPPSPGSLAPNLADYETERRRFSWAQARAELEGLPRGGGLNIAHEAVDRHAAGPDCDRRGPPLARRGWHAAATSPTPISASSTNRFANVLRGLGDRPGRPGVRPARPHSRAVRRRPRHAGRPGAVFCPLFSAFGPEPIRTRLAIGQARVLVTTRALYQRKVAALRAALPALEHVLVVDGGRPAEAQHAQQLDHADGRRRAPSSPSRRPSPRTRRCCTSPAARPARPRAPSTSTARRRAPHHREAGAGSAPRRCLLVHGRPRLGHRAPRTASSRRSTNGVTSIVDEADFDAERWYGILPGAAGYGLVHARRRRSGC